MREKDAFWKINSIAKAVSLLDVFTVQRPELSLSQICSLLDYPQSTVFNLIKTLESCGFIVKSKNSQLYRLGYKILELSYNMQASMPLIKIAIPLMEEIRDITDRNVYLTTIIDGQIIYLEGVYTSRNLVKYSTAGKILPMHCTASGKAMLSCMDETVVKKILQKRGLPASTPFTITNEEQFLDELKIIRQQGYAIDNQEESIGVICIAVPITGLEGRVLGALSISCSKNGFDKEKIQEYFSYLIRAANTLSSDEGLFPSYPYCI